MWHVFRKQALASWLCLAGMMLLIALPCLRGSLSREAEPKKRGALAGEQIFQTLTLYSHLPEPIQEPRPSLSHKFRGPWGPMRLWMLGPSRSCLDNPFSQVWEEREGTCKRTGFWDAELPLGMLASLRSPVPSRYIIS